MREDRKPKSRLQKWLSVIGKVIASIFAFLTALAAFAAIYSFLDSQKPKVEASEPFPIAFTGVAQNGQVLSRFPMLEYISWEKYAFLYGVEMQMLIANSTDTITTISNVSICAENIKEDLSPHLSSSISCNDSQTAFYFVRNQGWEDASRVRIIVEFNESAAKGIFGYKKNTFDLEAIGKGESKEVQLFRIKGYDPDKFGAETTISGTIYYRIENAKKVKDFDFELVVSEDGMVLTKGVFPHGATGFYEVAIVVPTDQSTYRQSYTCTDPETFIIEAHEGALFKVMILPEKPCTFDFWFEITFIDGSTIKTAKTKGVNIFTPYSEEGKLDAIDGFSPDRKALEDLYY